MSGNPLSEELYFEIADPRHAHIHVGRSPGENGVAIARGRADTSAHMRVASADHWIKFSLGRPTDVHCRLAGKRLAQTLQAGSLAVLPAGADAASDSEGPIDFLVLRVAVSRVAVGAAERDGAAAGLAERLAGRDDALLALVTSLFAEVKADYVNGPLFWNEVADRVIDHLIDHYLTRKLGAAGGTLSPATVRRLADYIRTHIDASLDVSSLAAVAGVSRYHFTRLFARSVGMTPHRYVTKLRLDAAVALARGGRLPLAEVALATGFVDQSHLSRWVRRVHGTTLARLAA